MSVAGVAKACERMLEKLKTDRTMQRINAKIMKKLIQNGEVNVKLRPLYNLCFLKMSVKEYL